MKRYAVHRTAAAPASRAIGSIALAITVAAFLAQRFAVIEADVFVLSLVVAALIALVGFVTAIAAFQRIWTRGGPGVPAALTGALLAIVAFVPPVLVAAMLVANPGASDIATNETDPPAIKTNSVASQQPFLNWTAVAVEEKVWPLVFELSRAASIQAIAPDHRTADIVPRRYRIAPGQLHVAGAKALENLNWTVVDELPPDLLDVASRLQAEGTTRALGLNFDVVLRIRPDRVGALLDVRARSRTPLRDLSSSAGHIRTVFAEIDSVLLETYGDLARLSVEEGDEEEVLEPDTLEEPEEVIPLPGFKPYFEEEGDVLPGEPDVSDLEG